MPPMVRDLSQTQKALMCPTSPLAYFGIVRFAVCDIGKLSILDKQIIMLPICL